MKICTISALYPPDVIGGAEMVAAAMDKMLFNAGHDVGVLTVENVGREALYDTPLTPVKITRVAMPRPYSPLDYADQSAWKKLVWHMQDHIDGRNFKIWDAFLSEGKPDLALVHVTQGLGFNGLAALAKHDIPTLYVLHDLSLACYKTNMFTKGHNCVTQCLPCRGSSQVKASYLNKIPRLGFVSPSQVNLDRVLSTAPLRPRPSRVILNPISYPKPKPCARASDRGLEILYAGQISKSKGIEFLLECVSTLPPEHRFHLTVLGDGPDLQHLLSRYGKDERMTFAGKVSLQDVADTMAVSDVQCVPSLWAENSPGAAIQALTQGLPVFGSKNGGIPALVGDRETGRLLPAEDKLAWQSALMEVLDNPSLLKSWAQKASRNAHRFEPQHLFSEYLTFIDEIMNMPQNV